jgi:hypothetical protein
MPDTPEHPSEAGLDAAAEAAALADEDLTSTPLVPIVKKGARPGRKERVIVDIGIDAEYQAVEVTMTDRKTGDQVKRKYNRILSYQWHGVAELDGVVTTWSGMYKPDLPRIVNDPGKKTRLTLAQWIGKALQDGRDQGALKAWPKRATVFSHFLRAEVGALKDFSERRTEFDARGGTVIMRAKKLTLSDAARLDPRRVGQQFTRVTSKAGNQHDVYVRLVDTLLLTPGRAGLAKAAEMVGMAKIDIPEPYSIERMEEFLRRDPDRFRDYALNDARIAVAVGRMMRRFCRDELHLDGLPSTIAAMALRRFGQSLAGTHDKGWERAADKRRRDLFGQHVVQTPPRFDTGRRVFVGGKKTDEPTLARQTLEVLPRAAYHGGRNECYVFGPTPEGEWYDFDIKGAYSIALCLLRPLAFDRAVILGPGNDPAQFTITCCGFAHVRFSFEKASPAARRFPCLPVRTDRGLLFPLTGESIATAAEITLALRHAAQIEVMQGLIIPSASDEAIFAPFSAEVNQTRTQLKAQIAALKMELAGAVDDAERQAAIRTEIDRHAAYEAVWKEIGNSLYGKTAQGVREKREFDPRRNMTVPVPPSEITSPFFAAQVTGYIRALLGEILMAVPADRNVVSATTDGFLCDLLPSDMGGLIDGPLARHFADLRHQVVGDEGFILEVKHAAGQIIAMRTRGQITASEVQGYQLVLAKAGVKPDVKIPAHMSREETQALHNGYMLDLFLNRFGGQSVSVRQLISLGEMWRTEADLVNLDRPRRLNLEFDLKRKPVDPVMRAVAGGRGEHLAFATEAWTTADEMAEMRMVFDAWQVGAMVDKAEALAAGASIELDGRSGKSCRRPRVLKTIEDFSDFEAYRKSRKAARAGWMRVSGGDTDVDLAVRTVLRAFGRQTWGLDANGWSGQALADWLSERGFPVTRNMVLAARRHPPAENRFEPSERIIDLVRAVKAAFPGFEVWRIVDPGLLDR